MGQHKRIRDETKWHDRGQTTIVPAGEPVEIMPLDKLPSSDRSTIEAGIREYQKHGRTFVPIKIRDWFAMIDSGQLE